MTTDPSTTKAVLGVASQLVTDVYKDVAQPAARRVGTALETVFKIGLSPVAMLDVGYEHSKAWLEEKIKARLADTPSNCVIAPPNNIAVPAMTRIAMSSDAPDLRELYAELLLKAMDSRTSAFVHPAYVLLIEQLSAEEAFVFIGLREDKYGLIFKDKYSSTPHYYGQKTEKTIETKFRDLCESLNVPGADRSQIWLDNLIRLGLVEIKVYTDAEFLPASHGRHGDSLASVKTEESREFMFTAFGRAFRDACAPPGETLPE